MRVFTRDGVRLDPSKQHEFNGQRLPAGWLLTAGADALAVFGIVETEEPDPEPEPPMRAVSPAEFRALFTESEKLAITEAGQTDAQVRILMDDVVTAPVIDLDFPRVIDGVQLLVQKGFLTQERAVQILAGTNPTDDNANA